MTAMGCTGVPDKDGIRMPIQDWPGCSKHNAASVATAGCSSNMATGLRRITAMGIAAMRAVPICKRFMDTATMRKRGNRGTTSRQVCVISISTLRSGVRGNDHAPFWISGRWSDLPTDCHKLSEVVNAISEVESVRQQLKQGFGNRVGALHR
jgi:hypothetical protein